MGWFLGHYLNIEMSYFRGICHFRVLPFFLNDDDYWADACIEMSIDLTNQTGELKLFLPYTNGCPQLKPVEYFKFVDAICRGLKLKTMLIADAASVFICKNIPRLRTLSTVGDFSVKVSALRFLNDKPAYYEQFGFIPIGRTFIYNIQLDGPVNAPKKILHFIGLTELDHPSLRYVLKKCLLLLNSVDCSKVHIKKWVCEKLNSLDIPIKYIKYY